MTLRPVGRRSRVFGSKTQKAPFRLSLCRSQLLVPARLSGWWVATDSSPSYKTLSI